MPGGWDLIMLNHSFEHMPEPAAVLGHLRERVNADGHIIHPDTRRGQLGL